MAVTPTEELARIDHALGQIHRQLTHFHLNPFRELETILNITDRINALRPRVQAVAGAFSTDIATAVANQKAADDEANAANVQDLANASAALDGLESDVSAAETAGGVQPPAPAPAEPVTDPNAPTG